MNVVREINKINERELELGISGSWHDDYKDSAYIFIGGLNQELTEGDVITIFSQYGEVMDVNLPRDKNTGKTKGFGFLMYEDQRSTILAVDNLNGAQVLGRTLRVDHVKNYKQPRVKGEDGEWADREEQSLNAKPELIVDGEAGSDSSEEEGPNIDPEDPMYEYLLDKWKEERAAKKASSKGKKSKHKDETPEERRARKERKKQKKLKKQGVKPEEKSDRMRDVEDLLNELEGMSRNRPARPRSPSLDNRRRSRSRDRRDDRDEDYRRYRQPSPRRRSPTPPRDRGYKRRSPSASPPHSSSHHHSRRHESPRRPRRDDDIPPPRRYERDDDIPPPRRRDRD